MRLIKEDRQATALVDPVKRYLEQKSSSSVHSPEPLPPVATKVEEPPSSHPESHIVLVEASGAPLQPSFFSAIELKLSSVPRWRQLRRQGQHQHPLPMTSEDQFFRHLQTRTERSSAFLHQTLVEPRNAMIPTMFLPALVYVKTGFLLGV